MVGGLAVHQTSYLINPSSSPIQGSEQRTREQHASCLPSLNQIKSIEEFKQVHAQFIKLGLDQVPRHASELLSACTLLHWGSMDYARLIFDDIKDPGTYDFNTMIRGCVKDCNSVAALHYYKEMLERDTMPNNFTFPFVLKACAQLSGMEEGTQVHSQAIKFGFESDIYIQNSLINMYGKCGEVKSSCKVFDLAGTNKTIASWSALLAAHTRKGLWRECLKLFTVRNNEGWRGDDTSMVSALTSCSHLGALDLGRTIHCSLLRNISEVDMTAQTALIDMYANCGSLEKGLEIFDRMPQKNLWTYSVMISGLAMHGDAKGALQIYSRMLKQGLEPDEVVYVGVLNACSHAGRLKEGIQCFDRMRFEHQIRPTLQHYNCMVDLMGRAGKLEEAHELIEGMPIEPDEVTWRCLLSACKVHGNLELAEIAYRNLLELDSQNTGDCIILSNMYAQAKRWEDAAKFRTDIVNRGLLQAPGFSRVEVKGKMHTFVSHDWSHPQSYQVYEMLYQMEWQLKFEGYSPDVSQISVDVNEKEKRRTLSGQSQKLALAFALLNTSRGCKIRIVTNIRMSRECHEYTALISKIFARETIIKDRHRFHHFKQGQCSCGGYW
ncbi:hypothetical protein J5N97_018825 [Dioscorea zingiberensis]|uniref:DYW domain-containing protein n=1 Tax=Dioscorea zingiberensis TaxID=325984 RepID=A0A9D5CCM3_9LILI|nr:hypothetical protein J5N97_018825 [Dioscorea zingiberensis]